MKFKVINTVLMLEIGEGQYLSFKDEWIHKLQALPYEGFGEFIHSTIYPSFTEKERKIWNNATINNRELLNAIHEYLQFNDEKT